MYATGVSKEGLRTAATVPGLFNMIVRLADSFGWAVPDWDRLMERAPLMLEGGYSMRSVEDRAGALERGCAGGCRLRCGRGCLTPRVSDTFRGEGRWRSPGEQIRRLVCWWLRCDGPGVAAVGAAEDVRAGVRAGRVGGGVNGGRMCGVDREDAEVEGRCLARFGQLRVQVWPASVVS